ncbi:MAG: hypothetical protein QOF05_912, partial [Sphingomonadales bacterium]|nr:hypothetical protein [Sphingomonadales bacterium]
MRLRDRGGLPLQPLHLQELQLLSHDANAPPPLCRGASLSKDDSLKPLLFLLSSAIFACAPAAPAVAQSMPGMTMPKTMPPKPAAKKKPAARKKTPSKKGATTGVKPGMPHADHAPAPTTGSPMEGMNMPKPAQPAPGATQAMPPMERMDHSQMGGMAMAHGDHGMAMRGALGSYPMERESSGTAWQPDASEHMGLMTSSGAWTLMAHGVLNFVYDHQSGPRGDDKAFASGMLMGMARRPLGNGTLQLRASISPDP